MSCLTSALISVSVSPAASALMTTSSSWETQPTALPPNWQGGGTSPDLIREWRQVLPYPKRLSTSGRLTILMGVCVSICTNSLIGCTNDEGYSEYRIGGCSSDKLGGCVPLPDFFQSFYLGLWVFDITVKYVLVPIFYELIKNAIFCIRHFISREDL